MDPQVGDPHTLSKRNQDLVGNGNELKTVCPECGKTLKTNKCRWCNGKGVIKLSSETEQECSSCDGSGKVLRCSKADKHFAEEAHRFSISLKERAFSQRQQCNLCDGKGVGEEYTLTANLDKVYLPCTFCEGFGWLPQDNPNIQNHHDDEWQTGNCSELRCDGLYLTFKQYHYSSYSKKKKYYGEHWGYLRFYEDQFVVHAMRASIP